MMRRLSLPPLICAVIIFTGFPNMAPLHSELIEPTRTLQDATNQPGLLSVFSEPPGLELWVDGKQAGKTPLISAPVLPGEHLLRLSDTERKINITSGKATIYSWFKGSLIEVPDPSEKSGDLTKADSSSGKRSQPKAPESAGRKEAAPNDPFYWPLNPRGPIY